MSNLKREWYLTSVIRENQNHYEIYYISSRLSNILKKDYPRTICQDLVYLKAICTAGKNVKWNNPLENSFAMLKVKCTPILALCHASYSY